MRPTMLGVSEYIWWALTLNALGFGFVVARPLFWVAQVVVVILLIRLAVMGAQARRARSSRDLSGA